MHSSDKLWSEPIDPTKEHPAEGVALLRAFCREQAATLYEAIRNVEAHSPFRQMVVPGGHTMSVAMTNTGTFGWTTDRTGYRYTTDDPETGSPWPIMAAPLLSLARSAAAEGGFADFLPNSCLINRYSVGARLSLHQDKNEQDYTHPIVSVSLGLPATFLLGTLRRTETPRRIRIEHGDVLVWGGPARLIFHGVAPIAAGHHPLTGAFRINLTFRRVAVSG
ncbi:DNA oxidative demethylase AlkB [Edaphobacter modestus]|uniref:Alkylated DNA repair protein (DNA oxidative demethylase) n=1 Tax=Edaphobacter modestus TaxID=388466 RepID=A0A4Q7YZY4_9BACT|nr:DNA oxidative demethylase AlkB [Edaphobacter modestus]RZU42755.1 alkylated DNA repair protein (DNA oxidative demethylase) [Edaphobacter modestus]